MPSVVINGKTYVSNNSTTPYSEIASTYANEARKQMENQIGQMGTQLATSKAGTAANYDSNAAQAYLNYVRQQNQLPEQLASQGINGGASESAMVRLGNNYALNQSNNNASRSAAMSQLQNTYDTNVAKLRADTEADILANSNAMAQQQAQYIDTLNQRALEQFSATIERFTSTKSIDKAIKNLDKSDPNYTAKKQLLQLRKAQLKGKSSGSGGGKSGGSRRSYGSSSSSSGSSSGSSSSSPSSAIQAAQQKGKSMTEYYKNAQKKANSKSRAGKAYKGSQSSYKNSTRAGIW